MTPSPSIEAFIKGFEKLRLKAFLPTPNDVPTIGWGATGSDIRLGMTWTKAQADARFTSDLAKFGAGVSKLVAAFSTTQGQFDALVSLAYNIGLGNLAKSTVLTRHRAGNHQGAAQAFAMWNKQNGKVLPGLTRRRSAEAAIYRGEADVQPADTNPTPLPAPERDLRAPPAALPNDGQGLRGSSPDKGVADILASTPGSGILAEFLGFLQHLLDRGLRP